MFLSESKLSLYWDRVKDIPSKSKGTIETIIVGPKVPQRIKTLLLKRLKPLRFVFESAENGIPLLWKWPAYKIPLKANAQPRRCPEPRWGNGAKRSIFEKWGRKMLSNGMFEHAPDSPFASRPHSVLKTIRGHTKDSPIFDVRIVGDYVYGNSQTVKMQPNAPLAAPLIEKAAGHPMYWYTDGDQQYQGLGLHENSRNMLSVWTPLGLIRPTRAQFGETNIGIVVQGALRVWREEDLDKYTRYHSVNIADDFTGWCDGTEDSPDWNGLLDSFIAHVKMCAKRNCSLKASKTSFGIRKATFFGAELSSKGYKMALHNLDPIRQLVRPEDVSELRRVLGLFVQHKDTLPTWGEDSKPLHRLTRNAVKWDWSEKCNSSFEKLRSQCLENKILAAPDFKK